MDIKQYISSGILELYVLGRLPPEETREVEANAADYPEIREEIEQIELTLEGMAMAMAPEVSPELLDRVLEDLPRGSTPKPPPSSGGSDTKTTSAGGFPRILPWLLALAGLLGILYYYFTHSALTAEKEKLEEQMQMLKQECEETENILLASEQRLRDLTNPATQNIILAGTESHPDNGAVVFYNTATNKAFFTPSNLPPPPAGKQYQLWAIDADGPKDLGVLALDISADDIIEVDFLPGVAAFAITLEDEGGKPAPDLTQLRVIGNVG
ncbi:anti-sigma factor [Neolewinella agarilytica]|uniref:Regulator of SigK n=1 Tax=Neolewinella agarilytica TaxID=478744 RepID=A0A1H8Z2I8_9BACT|nr:anti-sigma factor [Neolewinella agarilytica]SEP58675.1 Anti-sigma-K factor RskA [Neolewinella agarilytica]